MIGINKIDHICIAVRDLQEAEAAMGTAFLAKQSPNSNISSLKNRSKSPGITSARWDSN